MKYIERPAYIHRLLDLMGTPDIKIITGVRRSGKSELMKAYIRKIEETRSDANIIFVDFFDLARHGDAASVLLAPRIPIVCVLKV